MSERVEKFNAAVKANNGALGELKFLLKAVEYGGGRTDLQTAIGVLVEVAVDQSNAIAALLEVVRPLLETKKAP